MDPSPVGRHQASAREVIAAGDPRSIKRLYTELGDELWDAHRDDPSGLPLFSFAGTHPVVGKALDAVSGLVLDAGCGPNPALALTLARSGQRRVVALDISLGTVRAARAVGLESGIPLMGVVADVECLPFRRAAFDGVACDDTIEHLPDDVAGVSELARVARPTGRVVVATPNRRSLGVLRRKLRDRSKGTRHEEDHYYSSTSHLREYTWAECARLLDRELEIVGRHGVPFDGRNASPALSRWVNRIVTRRPFHRLGPMIVIAARPSSSGARR